MALQRGEPEYLAFSAWAVTCAKMFDEELSSEIEPPEVLLDRALEIDPKLESAWLFRARIAELEGRQIEALEAFLAALETNPNNEEASTGVEQLKAAGVSLEQKPKTSIEERLAGLANRLES